MTNGMASASTSGSRAAAASRAWTSRNIAVRYPSAESARPDESHPAWLIARVNCPSPSSAAATSPGFSPVRRACLTRSSTASRSAAPTSRNSSAAFAARRSTALRARRAVGPPDVTSLRALPACTQASAFVGSASSAKPASTIGPNRAIAALAGTYLSDHERRHVGRPARIPADTRWCPQRLTSAFIREVSRMNGRGLPVPCQAHIAGPPGCRGTTVAGMSPTRRGRGG